MQNKFKKFKLFQAKEDTLVDGLGITMLINIDHLVSIKPINVPTADGVVKAYWLRLSNGKKYKATIIPSELADLLGNETNAMIDMSSDNENLVELH